MSKHLRLWWRFVVQAAVRETHYRLNLVTTLVIGLVQLGVALIPVLLLFEYAEDIHGWSRAETLALVGLFQVAIGLLFTVLQPNLWRMGDYIVRGDLDGVLMRPVSSQFYVTFRWLNLAELGNVATGVVLLTYGLVQAGVRPSFGQVAQAGVLALCGMVLLGCAWSASVYLVFWLQQAAPVHGLIQAMLETGRYPAVFFPTVVRAFLTFAFPVTFATTFPIQALTDGVSWWVVLGGVGLCGIAVPLLRAYWRFALRSYASASS